MPKTRVLVVEDEPRMAALIKQTLERRSGIAVDIVGSGDAAVRSVNESLPNLIILDMDLPVLSGLTGGGPIWRLRTKLGPAGRQITTLVGLGCRFSE